MLRNCSADREGNCGLAAVYPTQAQKQGLNGAPSSRGNDRKAVREGRLIFGPPWFLPTGNKWWVPHFPGFPVKFVCVDELHAAFLNESRTRRRCLVPRTGNPGQAVLWLEWDNGSQWATSRSPRTPDGNQKAGISAAYSDRRSGSERASAASARITPATSTRGSLSYRYRSHAHS
jgi:hypothetical protein